MLSTWTPSNTYFLLLYKMLEKHLWNTSLLYVMVEIRQLLNEISSFPEVFHKRGGLENFSKFKVRHKKRSSGGVLSKDVLENFAKLTDKHLCRSLFFNKVAGWKPETFKRHWKCSVKQDSHAGAFRWNLQLFWRTSVNVYFEIWFKKRLQHMCFPVNFVNYSKPHIL